MADFGMISQQDVDMICYTDSVDEVRWRPSRRAYGVQVLHRPVSDGVQVLHRPVAGGVQVLHRPVSGGVVIVHCDPSSQRTP